MNLIVSLSQGPLINQAKEVLVMPKELSRHGSDDLQTCLGKLDKISAKKVLVWDILMVQKDFEKALETFQKFDLFLFDAIRVQDLGAFEYIKSHYPQMKLQFNAETGFHNTTSLEALCESTPNLEKIVLSLELSKKMLTEIVEHLKKYKVQFEVMGIGPLLLFYTPRNLLSTHFERSEHSALVVSGKSEETPHQGFRIVENDHGTFMFHPKDHLLLEHLDDLKAIGISDIRLDSAELSEQAYEYMQTRESSFLEKIKKVRPHIKGYFQTNKSDILFSRLKNKHFSKKGEGFIGEVISSHKDSYVAIKVQNQNIKVGDFVKIVTPESKEKRIKVKNLWDSAGSELNQAPKNSLVLMDFVKGVSKRSFVYLSPKV